MKRKTKTNVIGPIDYNSWYYLRMLKVNIKDTSNNPKAIKEYKEAFIELLKDKL